MNEINASGTTYDGATVLLQAATQVTSGTHSLYLSIFDQGDHIFDSAVFVDNIRFETVTEPSTQCRPGAEQKAKVPLIFIPGVGGSKLLNDSGEVWPRMQDIFDSDSDQFLYVLRLAPDGISPFDPNDADYTTIRPDDIIRAETVHDVFLGFDYTVDIYETTMDTLVEAGYQEGVDLFPFPYYDWRKDIEFLSTRLLDYVDEVRAQAGAERVDILAHSMGGLVTRTALARQESVGKVRRVITLGTPILGAPKILGMLEYQTPCFTEVPLFGCITNPATAQEILTNFPSVYQILPGPDFDTAEDPPLIIDRDTNGDGKPEGPQPYAQWSAIVRAHRNAQLMNANLAFHQAYDNLTLADPQVEFYRVVGDSLDTPDQIREYTACFLWVFNCRVAYEVVKANGDGTVPLHSADVYNPAKNFDYRNGIPNAYAHDVGHGELPKDERVLDFILSFFGTTPGTANMSVASFAAQSDSRQPEAVPDDWPGPAIAAESSVLAAVQSNGLSDTPEPLSGIELEVLGPLQAFVEDGNGNLLGKPLQQPRSVFYSAVPGGTYYSIGDTQTFFLNEAGSYTAHLQVADLSGRRLRVRTYADDRMAGQAVFQINAPSGAELHLTFAVGQDLAALRLQIDRDADGVIDQEVGPDSTVTGAVASDQKPPSTLLALHLTADRQCEITLSAQDQPGGSGIAATYYLLEGISEQPKIYASPFSFACGAVVKYASADRAGNMELIQAIQTIPLDIKPGSDPNSINLKSKSLVPVAILSTAGFDAVQVAIPTITLAGAPVARRSNGTPMAAFQDVNRDGRLDLVLHFATAELQLDQSSTEALLQAETVNGTPVLGVDRVRIVR
jgi:pimeloyl-ACP methyl ester carboxylesterase